MRDFRHALVTPLLLVALALVPGAQGEDLKVEQNPVPGDSFAAVSYPLAEGDQVKWEVSPPPKKVKSYVEGKTAHLHFNGPSDRKYLVTLDVINFESKKWDRKKVEVEVGKAPQPPPDVEPKPPTPPIPPSPPPTPAKTFYVVLVYERSKTPTREQNALLHGIAVEKWLQEKTTRDGEFFGFRRHDPDDPVGGDTDTMNSLWGKVKSALTPNTVLPAVAVARDGEAVAIEPLHRTDAAGNKKTLTPQELTALLDKYLQGK